MMIVVPVACATAEEAERQIENAKEADAVELRLDAFGKISAGEIKALVKMKKCIVTNRRKEEGGGMKEQEEEERISLLLGAIEAGPFAVDVELATASGLRQKVEKKAKEKGVKVILSFHDFEGTPGGLEEMVEEMLKEADFAKIVCLPTKEGDAERLLKIVEENKGKVVAFGLGGKASWTRVESLKRGAPFGFAVLESKTAPGQMSLKEMKNDFGEEGDNSGLK